MAIERWLAIASVGLFAMFAGEMISVYHFMANVPEDFAYLGSFTADPKILQFISIAAAPAGILAAVAFLMTRQYGSRPIGYMIIAAGAILLAGMATSYTYLEKIDPQYLTDAVVLAPVLFMVMSVPIFAVGTHLLRHKRKKPALY
ncbi:MAG: hypothetical protein EB829_01650 [Nitrosopumilus sp. H8]|nr:MAG: hypothetical protein EB830_05350 [Nitrosopumilus sp. H13]RNJ79627.1 MAG: hypothetical protein EB829_01650 [Nitrosopumilus sp. H8]